MYTLLNEKNLEEIFSKFFFASVPILSFSQNLIYFFSTPYKNIKLKKNKNFIWYLNSDD